MYTPKHFEIDDLSELHAIIRRAALANLVVTTSDGLFSTPLPLFLDAAEGPFGTLYGHFSRANAHIADTTTGEALAIFMGPEAYISPSWYETKRQTGKVVPTWNYVAIHAFGTPEFFDDRVSLLRVVARLTDIHEADSELPWKVDDAPADFVEKQLAAIVGFRLPISRIIGKAKMSQNRSAADRNGVADGLKSRGKLGDDLAASMIPR